MNALCNQLGIEWPIIQAPMAGVSTPAMAAAVSNAGGLGSISIGASTPQSARVTIAETQALTSRPMNVNVFCHRPAVADAEKESAWIRTLTPAFEKFGARPPEKLTEIYKSFRDDTAMLQVLLEMRPRVVSFHFGIPRTEQIQALKQAGIFLMASATNLDEAQAIQRAEIDAVIAQGYEAGGHRGVFDLDAPDQNLETVPLTHMLAGQMKIPVIAAGGIMNGAGIAAALASGASAAQMGTAFIACDESAAEPAAEPAHRQALLAAATTPTVMTRVISGRPARGLQNDFTRLGQNMNTRAIPDYPIAYDLGKALHKAAKAAGNNNFGAHWAGQGASLSRPMPAGMLVKKLSDELREAHC